MLATSDLRAIDFDGDISLLERHPLSEFFGDMSSIERQDMRESFEINPRPELCHIVLYEGKIMDGWHRTQEALNTNNTDVLQFFIYEGDDPAEYAILLNGSRRHSDSATRALAMAKCREWMQANTPDHTMTISEAAQEGNVSTRQINRANRVMKAGLGDLVPEYVTMEDAYDIAMDDDLLFQFHSGAVTIDEAVDTVQERRRAKRDERDLRRLTGEGDGGNGSGRSVAGAPGGGLDEPPPWDEDIGPTGPWEPPPGEPPPFQEPAATEPASAPPGPTQLSLALVHTADCCDGLHGDGSFMTLLDQEGNLHKFEVVQR